MSETTLVTAPATTDETFSLVESPATETKTKKASKKPSKSKKESKKASKKSTTTVKAKPSTNGKKKADTEYTPRDDARQVANACEDNLTPDQVRMLRAMKNSRKSIPLNRQEIKVACGMAPETLYSAKWLNDLWNLQSRKLIKIEDSIHYTDKVRPQHLHSITEKGKEILKKAEKALADKLKAGKKE